jgi:O-antigen ligase
MPMIGDTSRGVGQATLIPLAAGIVAYPVAWLCGFGAVFPPLMALAALLIFVVRARFVLPGVGALLLAFSAAYGVSLGGALLRDEPAARLLASAFNLTLWLTGVALLLVVVNLDQGSARVERQLARAFVALGVTSGLLSLALVVAWYAGQTSVALPSLAAFLLPSGVVDAMPTLLRQHVQLPLSGTLWAFETLQLPRLSVFHPYPTALALTSALSICAFFYLRTTSPRRPGAVRRIGSLVALGLLAVPLVFTFSRTVLLACLLVLMLLVVRSPIRGLAPRARGLLRAATVTALVGVVIVTVVSTPSSRAVAAVGGASLASTIDRLALYRVTLEYVADRPLLGHGYKPDTSPHGLQVPLGSHSTLLGTALKTGLVGLTLLGGFLAVLAYWALAGARGVADGASWLYAGVLVILLWSLTEDLDAPPLASYGAFVFMALAARAWRCARDVRRPRLRVG